MDTTVSLTRELAWLARLLSSRAACSFNLFHQTKAKQGYESASQCSSYHERILVTALTLCNIFEQPEPFICKVLLLLHLIRSKCNLCALTMCDQFGPNKVGSMCLPLSATNQILPLLMCLCLAALRKM